MDAALAQPLLEPLGHRRPGEHNRMRREPRAEFRAPFLLGSAFCGKITQRPSSDPFVHAAWIDPARSERRLELRERHSQRRAGQDWFAPRRVQQPVERQRLLCCQVRDHDPSVAHAAALLALVARREDRAV